MSFNRVDDGRKTMAHSSYPSMIDRPAFYSHITVRILDPDTVSLFLEDEGEERLLRGSSCGRIAELLDGSHTVDEIAGRFLNELTPAQVYYVLQRFESGGYLVSADSALPESYAAFWRTFGVEPESAVAVLRSSSVTLRVFGMANFSELQDELERFGIQISDDADFGVVLTDDYLNRDLHAWNLSKLSQGAAWIIGKPLGRMQWMGPIFRPGVTGCWCCLAHRLRANRKGVEFRPSRAGLPGVITAWTNLMAAEIAKWLVLGKSEALEGAVWTLDSRLVTTTHLLTRRPQCHCCGDTRPVPRTEPFELKRETARTTAEETVRNLERHVSPITGIIPMLREVQVPGNPSAHVYVALQNGVNSWDGPGGAMGKGSTGAEAMASCLAEAVERYSCAFDGTEPRIRAPYAELAPAAIRPSDLVHFSERQYLEREDWNGTHGIFQWVPERFDESLEIDWSTLWSLSRKRERYVPAAFCYFPYPGEDGRFFRGDSNGCASGNTMEEAVWRGLLELIERDAVALWWYSRAARPAVDLASFHDPFLRATQENLLHAGRTLRLLDLTNDLNIPAFASISWKEDGSRIVLGSAADVDPRIGAVRAVAEMNQVLQLAEGQEDRGDLSVWLRTANIAEHSYLAGSGEVDSRELTGASRKLATGARGDQIVGLLEHHNLEVLALDMTRSDIGFSTVRVIVPGLRHFWARLGPGRLYDVPFRLGWVKRPLLETELNPVAYML